MASLKQIFTQSSFMRSSIALRNIYGVNIDGNHAVWTPNNIFIQQTNVSKQYSSLALLNGSQLYAQPIASALCRFYSKSKSSKHKREYVSDSDSDSDSDNEGKKLRGESDFWRRKMRTLHTLLDINNDGVISYDDFKMLAKNFAALGHLTPEAETEFNETLQQIWVTQWGEITPYNLVNAEQYLTEMQHAVNDKELREKIHTFLPFLFKAVDKDHSGFISLTEYKLFFKCLGLTGEDAAVSFAVIDKNSDGKLSIKEFVKLGREYFLTEDERRVSRMFWGPLIEH